MATLFVGVGSLHCCEGRIERAKRSEGRRRKRELRKEGVEEKEGR